jgi:hypothetical protein
VEDHIVVGVAHALAKQLRCGVACKAAQRHGLRKVGRGSLAWRCRTIAYAVCRHVAAVCACRVVVRRAGV